VSFHPALWLEVTEVVAGPQILRAVRRAVPCGKTSARFSGHDAKGSSTLVGVGGFFSSFQPG
jgi:hypothetical protein